MGKPVEPAADVTAWDDVGDTDVDAEPLGDAGPARPEDTELRKRLRAYAERIVELATDLERTRAELDSTRRRLRSSGATITALRSQIADLEAARKEVESAARAGKPSRRS